MDELIKVQSKRTERVVYCDRQDFNNSEGSCRMIWGQVSRSDESGWFFNREDLEALED